MNFEDNLKGYLTKFKKYELERMRIIIGDTLYNMKCPVNTGCDDCKFDRVCEFFVGLESCFIEVRDCKYAIKRKQLLKEGDK